MFSVNLLIFFFVFLLQAPGTARPGTRGGMAGGQGNEIVHMYAKQTDCQKEVVCNTFWKLVSVIQWHIYLIAIMSGEQAKL